MFKIPLQFDYSEDAYPDVEYKFIESQNCWEVRFTPLSISFYYDQDIFSKNVHYLDIEKIEKLNLTFKAHGRLGYSLGCFHEFFLSLLSSAYLNFSIENAEISLGDATPFSRLIFEGEHKNDYHGDWDDIQSIRLLNVEQDELEVYLVNALNRIQVYTGIQADLMSISWQDYTSYLEQCDDSQIDSASTIPHQLKVYKDIEAVNLYRCALTTEDNIPACIYYYRIIEFYAFLRKHYEIENIRQDKSLSSKDFLKRIHELVKANERENICVLLEEVVTLPILDFAFNHKLTQSKNKKTFANAVYNFRNSIVHAKYEHSNSLIVDSILNDSSNVALWREVMSRLIPEILDKFGL